MKPNDNQQSQDTTEASNAAPAGCMARLVRPDFAYATIEEFEEIVGYKVGPAFRDGWRMARTTNRQLGIETNADVDAPPSEGGSPEAEPPTN